MSSPIDSSGKPQGDPSRHAPAASRSEHWLGLAGRVCVVSGAGSGIGAAIAQGLAGVGARVALVDRNVEGAVRLAAALREQGATASAWRSRSAAGSAAWMPVSRVPLSGGKFGVFPHLLDRYKPGIIGVLRNGKRFTNEANSYHDVGAAMIEACKGQQETAMWLVCDQATIGKYGLGYAKPAPMPLGSLVRAGYLFKGKTLVELASNAGLDAAGLEATVSQYNVGAARREDTQFGRGTTSFNRYLADPDNKPNPCVAPIGKGPYYAVKVLVGDLGTFDGIRTNVHGQVLDDSGSIIAGLYAVGNDRASIMGGNYPGAGITLGPNMTFGYITGRHVAGIGAAEAPPAETDAAARMEGRRLAS